MEIVPNFSHLKNIKMQVMYRELGPATWPPPTPKWKQDPDAEANFGYAPGTKTYINGCLINNGKAKLAVTSSFPFPAAPRVPRWAGIIEVLPHYKDYEKVCREQGLHHLLEGVNGTSNVEKSSSRHLDSIDGSIEAKRDESNISTDEKIHHDSDTSLTRAATYDGLLNGVDGIVQG